jgi:hypothetical protein
MPPLPAAPPPPSPAQVSITTMHLARWQLDSGWLSIIIALQFILLCFKLQYFSRVFRKTRFSFLDSLQQVGGTQAW